MNTTDSAGISTLAVSTKRLSIKQTRQTAAHSLNQIRIFIELVGGRINYILNIISYVSAPKRKSLQSKPLEHFISIKALADIGTCNHSSLMKKNLHKSRHSSSLNPNKMYMNAAKIFGQRKVQTIILHKKYFIIINSLRQ